MSGLNMLNFEAQRDVVLSAGRQEIESWFAFPFDVPAELTAEDYAWMARHLELAGVERRYVGPTFIDPSLVLAVAR